MEHSLSSADVTEAFARRFAARAGNAAGVLTFAGFMDLALYDPEVGYYQARRARVGQSFGTDFYTSASLGDVFGALVAAAATALIGATRVGKYEFIEIGAEPDRGVLDGVTHGFRATRAVRIGEPLNFSGALVVFSNELFDAQPFHRLVFRGGSWTEMGVALAAGKLTWTELPGLSPPVAGVGLPQVAPEGYVLDLPLGAERLARTIAAQPWHGLFLAFDYGRIWSQLLKEYPAGTARSYATHRQSGDLLAQPGSQDLTCHVCWDWIEAALRDTGFGSVMRESQEAFFVHQAGTAMERIVAEESDPLGRRRTQLRHLLHPALLGQRFEALWGMRAASAIHR